MPKAIATRSGRADAFADNREIYIQHRLAGIRPEKAAELAGFAHPRTCTRRLEARKDVKRALSLADVTSRQRARWTRERVMDRLEAAINMGELISDPSAMIRGLQEINKMQGYYAPETKELILSPEMTARLDQISQLSEADLLARLGKKEAYIDAEFERVEK